MTKRWSSTRSDLGKTKRQASKERRAEYDPVLVKEILAADAAPIEAKFDNVDDLLAYLNKD